MLTNIQLAEVLATIFYTLLGFGLFLGCYMVIDRLSGFSLRREILEEHNMAVAIVIGALLIALSILISAVIQ